MKGSNDIDSAVEFGDQTGYAYFENDVYPWEQCTSAAQTSTWGRIRQARAEVAELFSLVALVVLLTIFD